MPAEPLSQHEAHKLSHRILRRCKARAAEEQMVMKAKSYPVEGLDELRSCPNGCEISVSWSQYTGHLRHCQCRQVIHPFCGTVVKLCEFAAHSATCPGCQPIPSHTQRKRVALVIGVSKYRSGTNLHNCISDASKIHKQLEELGFNSCLLQDPTLKQVQNAQAKLTEDINTSTISLLLVLWPRVQHKHIKQKRQPLQLALPQ